MPFLPWVPTGGSITLPVPIADGGTGQTTQQAALDALAGAVTNGEVLSGNGTHVALRALAAADLAGILTAWKGTASGIVPSATANTLGAAVTVTPDSGFTGVIFYLMNAVTTGLGSETVTLQSVVTFSDNSTNTQAALTTFTTNATTSAALNTIVALIGSVDNKTIKSVAWSVKSTINSSAASVTVNLVGVNLP